MKRELPLIHHSIILLADWLEPMGISPYALAKTIITPKSAALGSLAKMMQQ